MIQGFQRVFRVYGVQGNSGRMESMSSRGSKRSKGFKNAPRCLLALSLLCESFDEKYFLIAQYISWDSSANCAQSRSLFILKVSPPRTPRTPRTPMSRLDECRLIDLRNKVKRLGPISQYWPIYLCLS